MKGLYQIAKNYIIKPLIAIVLGTSGCNVENSATRRTTQPSPTQTGAGVGKKQVTDRGNYFTNWGIVSELRVGYTPAGGVTDDLEIRLGDMDGDGDLDIVVGSRATGLEIYENRIPQKK